MKAKILSPSPDHIELTAQAIRQGKVVGMPTETVYGLAGDARSPAALARIFETKERPTFDPLIIHVDPQVQSLSDLEKLALVDSSQISNSLRQTADNLIRAFWPGPLTLVLPKHPTVPDLATSGLPSVALRMPRHPIAQALILSAQTPLAAPSANRFGRISPTTAQAVAEELGNRIEWILDGGSCEIGVESTVVRLTQEGKAQILRPGGISAEALQSVLGNHSRVLTAPVSHSNPAEIPALAPGMLESHYAPAKLLKLLPQPLLRLNAGDLEVFQREFFQKLAPDLPVGLLLMSGDPTEKGALFSEWIQRPVVARTLSVTGNLAEAARNLFSEMRWLDSSGAAFILAEPAPTSEGLGYAISDRLKRASAKR